MAVLSRLVGAGCCRQVTCIGNRFARQVIDEPTAADELFDHVLKPAAVAGVRAGSGRCPRIFGKAGV